MEQPPFRFCVSIHQMTDKPDLHVEMQGDYIIITLCVQLDSFQL